MAKDLGLKLENPEEEDAAMAALPPSPYDSDAESNQVADYSLVQSKTQVNSSLRFLAWNADGMQTSF